MAIVLPKQLNKAKSFLDGVLAALPEDKREEFRTQYSQAQDELSGIAREIETATTRVNAVAEKQGEWYEQHKDVITGKVKAVPVDATGNPIAAAVDRDAVMKDVTKSINDKADELAGQGLYLATVLPTLIDGHRAEFGEGLDGRKLAKDAIAAGMDIEAFYNHSVAEKRAARASAKYTEDIAKATETGRLAGLKEAGNGHMPYPVSAGGRPPTTLDGLRKLPEGQAATNTLEAAVATAVEVMSKQT